MLVGFFGTFGFHFVLEQTCRSEISKNTSKRAAGGELGQKTGSWSQKLGLNEHLIDPENPEHQESSTCKIKRSFRECKINKNICTDLLKIMINEVSLTLVSTKGGG